MFAASNIQYEMSARQHGVAVGGIGAIHLLARQVGLVRELDRVLHLLKRHLPYHESDHVLNLVYNIMCGNTRLEDLELLRQNESYMDMLGAQRIPDPTTEGDFLRRFAEADIVALLDAVNGIRQRMWTLLPRDELKRAVIDGDGTDAPTDGEKKEGIGLSYKSVWGYNSLLISLANTQEPLFIVNRPGNVPSHTGAAEWFDKAIALCEGAFDEILLRGDTDFSLTVNFDRWSARNVKFVFGYDAHRSLVAQANEIPEAHFRPLVRWPKYEVQTRQCQGRDREREGVHEYPFVFGRDCGVRVLSRQMPPSVSHGCAAQESLCGERRGGALRRRALLLLHHQRSGNVRGRGGVPSQRSLQSGEPHRATQEWRQRDAGAGLRSDLELGLHGHRFAGVDAEGLVCAILAASGGSRRRAAHGIQAVPQHAHPRALPGDQGRTSHSVAAAELHQPRALAVRTVARRAVPANRLSRPRAAVALHWV
jgi:hypothetical protein